VDDAGSAYITGYTNSINFPSWNSYQATDAGNFDAFVTKLAPDGMSLIFSTYFGGTQIDSGTGIGVDRTHNVYIAGHHFIRSSNGESNPRIYRGRP
jgi:hypothetical protein